MVTTVMRKIKDDDATEWPETDHGRCPWAGYSGEGSWRNDENEREDGNTRKTLQAESTASAKVLRQDGLGHSRSTKEARVARAEGGRENEI